MRIGTVPILATLLGIAACDQSSKPPGTYISAYNQGVWDLATAPGGSCERACCEMPGGEFGTPGVWSQQRRVCTWHPEALQLMACTNWCNKEIARAGEIERIERRDQLEQVGEQEPGATATESEPEPEDPSNGKIEARENMGSKYLVLEGMETPVTAKENPGLVETLELGFSRGPETTSILIYIAPKRVVTTGWKYLKCHEVGLMVGEDWSAGGAKGSDGSWLRFESMHDGSTLESGGTLEYVSFNVEAATVREWAFAADSGGQICRDQFSLSSAQKAKILEFLETPI